MDRALLRTLLAAGPSRCLDVLGRSTTALAQDPAARLLFQTPYLNRSILFKVVDTEHRERVDPFDGYTAKPVRTLLYFPYDPSKPANGGEAFVYSPAALRRLHAARTNRFDEPCTRLAADVGTLELLDDVPTFSPFLLREAFDRCGRHLPEAYFRLDVQAAERLRQRLRVRVKPLILAALRDRGARIEAAVDRMVEVFLDPASGGEIGPLAAALRLDAAEAADVLAAWAGIAYFEDELARLTPHVRSFAAWLGSAPKPREYLPANESADVERQVVLARRAIRAAWQELRGIFDRYQASYSTLVLDEDPRPFIAFLRSCRRHYWRSGDLAGRFEQAIHAWQIYSRAYPDEPLPVARLNELLRFLIRTFVTAEASDPVATFTAEAAAPLPPVDDPLLALGR